MGISPAGTTTVELPLDELLELVEEDELLELDDEEAGELELVELLDADLLDVLLDGLLELDGVPPPPPQAANERAKVAAKKPAAMRCCNFIKKFLLAAIL